MFYRTCHSKGMQDSHHLVTDGWQEELLVLLDPPVRVVDDWLQARHAGVSPDGK